MKNSLSSARAIWSIAVLLGTVLFVASCGGGGVGSPDTTTNPPNNTTPTTPINGEAPALPFGNPPGASVAAKAMATALGAGVNFGNIFEAPTDNAWGIPFDATTSLTPVAANMGFKSVRLPVRWSNHASGSAPYTIEPAFMARVKATVQALNAQGLIVVLNMHHYRDLDGDTRDFGELAAPNANHRDRMVLMWKQIADEFKSFPNDKLLFEVYNEPHLQLQTNPASSNDPWNALLARAMGQIRATNPDRVVVVGPTGYNNTQNLKHLRLPNDANMIVTIHQYEPFSFTHQGAPWIVPRLPTGQTCCSADQKNQITQILQTAKTWSTQNNYPIYLGEFGAYSNNDYSTNMTTQRVNFNTYMREEMSRLEFSWAYWELAASFGVYDRATQTTRTPLLQSLIPAPL
jgi:endoglucanase